MMNDSRMAALRERFGEKVEDWPPPHRGEALDYLNGKTRALHAALVADTDEAALSRAVLTRLATPPRRRFAALWHWPNLVAGYAALLMVFGFAGYMGAGGLTADPILALALGQALPGLAGLQ